MGFGNYDESEQQNQEIDADDGDAVSVHENDRDGKVSSDSGASTTDLLDKLDGMKDVAESE